jgi:hypothetical protein
MPVVNISLNIAEHEALHKLARRERRNLKGQAAIVIRRELERVGLLPADPAPAQAEAQPQEAARVEAAQPA